MRRINGSETRFTGRMRIRSARFGGQVLQREMEVQEFNSCPPYPGSDPAEWRERMKRGIEPYYVWKDATQEEAIRVGVMVKETR